MNDLNDSKDLKDFNTLRKEKTNNNIFNSIKL